MDHQVFAQMLGNYGEFVGAIAVVITLGNLAVQIRQNKEATEKNSAIARADSQRHISERWQDILAELARDEVQVRLLARGMARFEGLEAAGQAQFSAMMSRFVMHLDLVIELHDQDLETSDHLKTYSDGCLSMLQTPGAKAWWSTIKPMFPIQTRTFIDNKLSGESVLPPPWDQALPFYRDIA